MNPLYLVGAGALWLFGRVNSRATVSPKLAPLVTPTTKPPISVAPLSYDQLAEIHGADSADRTGNGTERAATPSEVAAFGQTVATGLGFLGAIGRVTGLGVRSASEAYAEALQASIVAESRSVAREQQALDDAAAGAAAQAAAEAAAASVGVNALGQTTVGGYTEATPGTTESTVNDFGGGYSSSGDGGGMGGTGGGGDRGGDGGQGRGDM